jgi:hypothetical protein
MRERYKSLVVGCLENGGGLFQRSLAENFEEMAKARKH